MSNLLIATIEKLPRFSMPDNLRARSCPRRLALALRQSPRARSPPPPPYACDARLILAPPGPAGPAWRRYVELTPPCVASAPSGSPSRCVCRERSGGISASRFASHQGMLIAALAILLLASGCTALPTMAPIARPVAYHAEGLPARRVFASPPPIAAPQPLHRPAAPPATLRGPTLPPGQRQRHRWAADPPPRPATRLTTRSTIAAPAGGGPGAPATCPTASSAVAAPAGG